MFLDRLLLLCNQNNTDISTVLRVLGLSTSKGTAWRKGSIPNGEILLKLANYFHVSTDYLLGNTDDPRSAAQQGNENSLSPEEKDRLSAYDLRLLNWFHSLPQEKRNAILTVGDAPEDLHEDSNHE